MSARSKKIKDLTAQPTKRRQKRSLKEAQRIAHEIISMIDRHRIFFSLPVNMREFWVQWAMSGKSIDTQIRNLIKNTGEMWTKYRYNKTKLKLLRILKRET